jgi:hypothetical protein
MKKPMALFLAILGLALLSFPGATKSSATASWDQLWGPVCALVVGWEVPGPDVPGGSIKSVVYGVKVPEGDIHLYNGTAFSWTKIGGPGKKFVTHGNTLYGHSLGGGGVFKYSGTPGQWTQVGGIAGEIYGGLSGLFATNPYTGDILAYNCNCGGTFRSGWTLIGGRGKMFAVSAQHVYGLTPDGSAIMQFDFTTMKWTKIGNAAAGIYAGGRRLYATNPQSGNIWEYNEDIDQWAEVGGPGLMFAVDAFKGELYGLSPDGSGVYKYTGTPGQWTRIGNAAASIYAGWPTVYATTPTTLDLMRYTP